jgi:pimeloyl-ACP methyl ester carboxylesterase
MSANSLEHHSVHLNGIKQHYVKAGSGPAVMLLHGWPQTWYEWRHVIGLLGSEFTVIAPDLRGFGYSSKPASGYDAATIAADLASLSAHFGLKDVTGIGHDWSAVFGYVYAASHRDHVSALQGKERPYLQWFYEHFAYDPSAISASDIDVYVAAITQVGALRAGLAVYQDYFTTAEQVVAHSKKPLTIPVRAFGGEACLGGLTLTSVKAVAANAQGGVIERCGHWAAEERPDFVANMVRQLVKAGQRTT